jgi:hypothetical protein
VSILHILGVTEFKDTAKRVRARPVLVAHAYNPRYLGGRDQEDHGSKPAWANSFWD